MAPAPRIRPYKDFLTPALHRRFAEASGIVLGVCYVVGLLIGEWNDYIWSWFPLGRAGIRTLLIFIPIFSIFILRISQLHVGYRTSNSGWDTFKTYAPRAQTVQTVGWYFFSAYVFSEVYIWSVPNDADLNRIKLVPKTTRTTLNERPLFLTSFFFFLAAVQAIFHLYYDYDRVDMPITKTKPQASSDQNLPLVVPPLTQLKSRLPAIILTSLKRSALVTFVSPFIYAAPLLYPVSIRTVAWSFNRSWAKIFWNLPKSGSLPSHWPFHYSLLLRMFLAGVYLTLLWEVVNTAFSVYGAQEPLKNERPVTYESRDPNGSLLTGLRGKKLQTRAFAFWELVYISQRFEGRRKAIFEDIDRKGGSTWSQLLEICLEVVNGITSRINEYENPTAKPAGEIKPKPEDILGLPRLSQPIKDGLKGPGDIFTKPRKATSTGAGVAEVVGNFAKSHGQSPSNSLSPRSKKLIEKAENAILTKEQKDAVAAGGVSALFKEWALWVICSPLGFPFRQEYRRRIEAVVLGSPYGDVGIIVDAVDSLTRLAVCSLKEDKFGNVQRDVKTIIQTFTATILRIEGFKKSIGFHWTDIERKQQSEAVDTILIALKGGLKDLVDEFGGFSQDLKLSQSELRTAREAYAAPLVGATPEMEVRR